MRSVKNNKLNNLSNASYTSVSNSNTTVVSGAANTNGVIIKAARVDSRNGIITILIGGSTLISATGSTSNTDAAFIENCFVPAGQEVRINSSNANQFATMVYEVL